MPDTWVVRAEQPIDYALGRTFAVFQICLERGKAGVFVGARAREIHQGLVRLFPAAALEPATFDEWVEQQAG